MNEEEGRMREERDRDIKKGDGGATELKSQIPIWSGNECGGKSPYGNLGIKGEANS